MFEGPLSLREQAVGCGIESEYWYLAEETVVSGLHCSFGESVASHGHEVDWHSQTDQRHKQGGKRALGKWVAKHHLVYTQVAEPDVTDAKKVVQHDLAHNQELDCEVKQIFTYVR